VGEAVAKDPALTARLLQTVNSAFFGLTHRVADPTEAVTILGVETAKSVLLCVQVFTHFEGIQAGNLSAESLWKHSLSVAGLCKQITLAETGDRARADEAFTAGLLHDVGKLLLACNLPQDYDLVLETARQSQSPLCQVERQTFGATHEEVGAYVLGLWGLPIPVLEAVGFHHRPQERAGDSFALLTAVHVANSIVHFLHPDGSTLLPATVDLDYLDKLGLQSRQSTWLELAEGKPVELPSPDQFTVRKSSPEGRPADPLPPVSLWWQWVRIPSALSLLVGFTVWVLVHQGRGTVSSDPVSGTAAAQMSQDSQGAAPAVEAEPAHPSPAAPGTPLAASTNTPPAHPSR
jgi:HD-like signal output (HDOD) protein